MMLERRGTRGALGFTGSLMTLAVLLVAWVAAVSALQPAPAAHLTPPKPSIAMLRRNDTAPLEDQEPAEEMQQEESRSPEWLVPRPRGLNVDRCNPCDKVPWVPVARALSLDSHYALSVPAVPINLPISYGIPVTQLKSPSSQYGPPPHQQSQPNNQYGPPPSQQSPPTNHYGPPQPQNQYGPPPSQQSPPTNQYGPPPSQQSPPTNQYGPPPPHNQYGSPPSQQIPPTNHYGPPPSQQIPPTNHYGPPHSQHNQPQNHYGSPSSQQLPPPNRYGPPPSSQSAPTPQYGPPAGSDSRDNSHLVPDDHYGLPPPPLPQRFTTPQKTYGPPQPQTQHVSASDPAPQLLSPLDQQLPNVKHTPAFHGKPQQNHNPPSRPPPTGPSQNYRHLQSSAVKTPVLVGKPMAFPAMSKVPIPPLYSYQPFHNGKPEDLYPFLQPPKPQNVVVTITETDDDCEHCKEQIKLKDSEPAPAEPVTENIRPTTTNNVNPLEHQKPSVQVVKSIPLAEYLASVEYPMQIIQAPILDVPDLSKYWDLGYHNFPQVSNQQSNGLNPVKATDQNPSPSYVHLNEQIAVFLNHNTKNNNATPGESVHLDDVNLDHHSQVVNNLPYNHKPNEQKGGTTEEGFTSSPFSQTPTVFLKTTQGSHISHISKAPQTEPSKQVSTESSTHQASSASPGHFVTTQPLLGMTEMQPPKTDAPMIYNSDSLQSSSQELKLTTPAELSSHPALSNLRYINPSLLGPGANNDWSMHTYGRGWGHTPQPFVQPTAASHKPRFEVRPSPAPSSKKPKLIQQIIVPYTTNKHPASSPHAQEPGNSLSWTPLPPTNQGRKVPNGVNLIDQFPSSTGGDNTYQQNYPSGGASVPLSATGSENVASHHIFPLTNGQAINLPPHIINQILQRNPNTGVVAWPSGPDNLQQLLTTNLQGLLRGEEDSVDFARLQKNIDNWTAEGYKQNSPSVNFIPVTDTTHVYNSKKIPDEYLTATEPSRSNSSREEPYHYYQHKAEGDADGAASQRHQVKIAAHAKDEEVESPEDTLEGFLNSWSLLDTKMSSTSASTEAPQASSEATSTSKVWEKVQVSISPLTQEKVYVVTPVSVTEDPQAATSTPSPHQDQLHHSTS